MKSIVGPIAIAVILVGTVAVVGSANEAKVASPAVSANALGAEVAPEGAAPPSVDPAEEACRGAAWPHLPPGCASHASAERKVRIIR